MAKKRRTQAGGVQRGSRISRQFAHGDLNRLAAPKLSYTHAFTVTPPFYIWSIVADGVHIKSDALLECS